jgi:hypothetical protein
MHVMPVVTAPIGLTNGLYTAATQLDESTGII